MRTSTAAFRLIVLLVMAVAALTAVAAEAPREPAARVSVTPAGIEWQPALDYETAILTIQHPDGEIRTRTFRSGDAASIRVKDLGAHDLDGVYAYELRVIPRIAPSVRARLAAARAANDEAEAERIQREAGLPKSYVASGHFTVVRGAVTQPGAREESAGPVASNASAPERGRVAPDMIIPEDLYVIGQACIGQDCTGLELLMQTILLKENNTSIRFEDTSSGPGFPSNDWQITANDSNSGGANKLAFEDVTGATVPVVIEAGAVTNSVYVDSTGRIGFRTAVPVLDLHVNSSNTPALRLEQNSSGGFAAQTWDVAGNEANFFVRDVTGGSRLPFRIRPGAPTNSLMISASGNIGLSCDAPASDLVIASSSGCATPTSSINAGATQFTVASSRTIKENLERVEAADILQKIRATGVYTYDFVGGPRDRMGLVAEEFHGIFGRGSERFIDGQEVQMALWLAVQQLAARNEELARELADLRKPQP